MSSPSQTVFEKLDMLAQDSGLVRVDGGKVAADYEAKVAAHPHRGRLRRLVHEAFEFGADYVYFRLHPSTGAPRAEIFIFDRTGATASVSDLPELQLNLWNYGQVPLMFVLRREAMHIHSLLAKPELDEQGKPKLSAPEILSLAADVMAQIEAEKWQRFHARRFDNGTFWEGNPLLTNAQTSIESLVEAMREAREEIEQKTKNWDDKNLAKRLMIFVIMIRFLEEKKVLSGYFKNISLKNTDGDDASAQEACRFEDIVSMGEGGTLAHVLGMLEHDLNGDVFRLREGKKGPPGEKDLPSERELIGKLKKKDLVPIAEFATGRVSKKQHHLWDLYRFDHLPVEAMSYIYEDFLGGEENAFYTPHLLAELLLDEAMEPAGIEKALNGWTPKDGAAYRLIDPTCGSGVFLVGAWRRLVEAWRTLHPGEVPGMEVLSALMTQNIYGVDIKADAIDLTCFSLSVALCSELIRNHGGDGTAVFELLRKHKLPSMKSGHGDGRNLFGGEDFFELLRVGLPHEGGYSLVIGNPPFDNELSDKSKWLLQESDRGKNEKISWPQDIPGKQICYLFLREAPRLLKAGGLVCLIQKDGFLYNLGAKDFRAALFHNWRVPQVLDFISIRHLFDAAKAKGGEVDTKVVAVFVEAAPPEDNEVITHVTFRKLNSVEQRLFFEVDAYDVHHVPLDVAVSEPKVWKANLLGGGRLLQTYHAVKGERTIESFLESKKYVSRRPDKRSKEEKAKQPDVDYDGEPVPPLWFCSEGFKGDGSGKHRPRRRDMPCIAPESFNVIPPGNHELEYFERPRDYAIFCAPHLLIREHEDLSSMFRDGLSEGPLLYRNNVVGIACPPGEVSALENLAHFMAREQLQLLFFAAFGPRYMVNKQSALQKQDIMDLPFPENGRLEFRGVEPALRDDVLNHMIPLIKYGTGHEKTADLTEAASGPQMEAFAETLVKVLRNVWKNIHVVRTMPMGVAWCMACSLTGDCPAEPSMTADALTGRLDPLLNHQAGSSLRFRRVVRMFDGDMLYLIKPKEYRFWLPSVAVRDADEVVGSQMHRAVTEAPKAGART